MTKIAPLRPKPDAVSPVETGKRPKLADFPVVLSELASSIVEQALKLPKQQFDMRLDAFKAATAYQAMLNKQDSEGAEGGGINDIREALVERPDREPLEEGALQEEEDANGGAEDP